MLGDVLVWLLQGCGLAFVAWGGYLCLSERERRSGRDRRRAPRGGRRLQDALPAGTAAARPMATSAMIARGQPTPGERAARMVA